MIFDPDHIERFDEYGPTRPILEGEQFVSAKDYDRLLRFYRNSQNSAKSMTEEVCIEYAIAVFHVRLQTSLIKENPCEVVAERCCEFEAALESRPSNRGLLIEPDMDDCIAKHWRYVVVRAHDGEGREVPELAYEDMCGGCKERLKAVEDRKAARKRLGAAKRSIEATGKRLQKNHEVLCDTLDSL